MITKEERLSRILALADALVAADSRLRVANNEEDTTKELNREAATFVKLNGKRIGRDLELYNFRAEVDGDRSVAVLILEELVLPLRLSAPKAFAAGIKSLRAFDVFGNGKAAWTALLDDLISMNLPGFSSTNGLQLCKRNKECSGELGL